MSDDEQADVDPRDGRDETRNERMDRNWNDLLQELRVTQTGTQILSGFLLTLVFQPRFASLDPLQKGLYVGLVLLSATTIVLGLAPVNLHRALFHQLLKPSIVRFGHVALRLQIAGVALIVVGTVLLILDVGLGRRAGLIGAAGVLLLVLAAAAVPRFLRSSPRRPPRARRLSCDRDPGATADGSGPVRDGHTLTPCRDGSTTRTSPRSGSEPGSTRSSGPTSRSATRAAAR